MSQDIGFLATRLSVPNHNVVQLRFFDTTVEEFNKEYANHKQYENKQMKFRDRILMKQYESVPAANIYQLVGGKENFSVRLSSSNGNDTVLFFSYEKYSTFINDSFVSLEADKIRTHAKLMRKGVDLDREISRDKMEMAMEYKEYGTPFAVVRRKQYRANYGSINIIFKNCTHENLQEWHKKEETDKDLFMILLNETDSDTLEHPKSSLYKFRYSDFLKRGKSYDSIKHVGDRPNAVGYYREPPYARRSPRGKEYLSHPRQRGIYNPFWDDFLQRSERLFTDEDIKKEVEEEEKKVMEKEEEIEKEEEGKTGEKLHVQWSGDDVPTGFMDTYKDNIIKIRRENYGKLNEEIVKMLLLDPSYDGLNNYSLDKSRFHRKGVYAAMDEEGRGEVENMLTGVFDSKRVNYQCYGINGLPYGYHLSKVSSPGKVIYSTFHDKIYLTKYDRLGSIPKGREFIDGKKSVACTDWSVENFSEWECTNCWICGLPLWWDYARPEGEHKIQLSVMACFGVGPLTKLILGKVNDEVNSRAIAESVISSSSWSTIRGKLLNDSNFVDWKRNVRGEGYAWSHSFCNRVKNDYSFVKLGINNINGNLTYYINYPGIKRIANKIFRGDLYSSNVLYKSNGKWETRFSGIQKGRGEKWHNNVLKELKTMCNVYERNPTRTALKRYTRWNAEFMYNNIVRQLETLVILLNRGFPDIPGIVMTPQAKIKQNLYINFKRLQKLFYAKLGSKAKNSRLKTFFENIKNKTPERDRDSYLDYLFNTELQQKYIAAMASGGSKQFKYQKGGAPSEEDVKKFIQLLNDADEEEGDLLLNDDKNKGLVDILIKEQDSMTPNVFITEFKDCFNLNDSEREYEVREILQSNNDIPKDIFYYDQIEDDVHRNVGDIKKILDEQENVITDKDEVTKELQEEVANSILEGEFGEITDDLKDELRQVQDYQAMIEEQVGEAEETELTFLKQNNAENMEELAEAFFIYLQKHTPTTSLFYPDNQKGVPIIDPSRYGKIQELMETLKEHLFYRDKYDWGNKSDRLLYRLLSRENAYPFNLAPYIKPRNPDFILDRAHWRFLQLKHADKIKSYEDDRPNPGIDSKLPPKKRQNEFLETIRTEVNSNAFGWNKHLDASEKTYKYILKNIFDQSLLRKEQIDNKIHVSKSFKEFLTNNEYVTPGLFKELQVFRTEQRRLKRSASAPAPHTPPKLKKNTGSLDSPGVEKAALDLLHKQKKDGTPIRGWETMSMLEKAGYASGASSSKASPVRTEQGSPQKKTDDEDKSDDKKKPPADDDMDTSGGKKKRKKRKKRTKRRKRKKKRTKRKRRRKKRTKKKRRKRKKRTRRRR